MDWNAVLRILAVCPVVGLWTAVIVRLPRERLAVSPISYDGCRIGQTGRLTYRGSRVPDWRP